MNELNSWLVGGGLAVGAIFAIALQRFRFCLVAGISSWLLIRDARQSLAFATAALVAITGTQLLEIHDIVPIAESAYRNSSLDWFGATFGGLLFGIGATLAGGCAARTLLRSMEGSAHSMIVLLAFAVVAAITQFGFLEPVRLTLTHSTAISLGTDAGLAAILSVSPWLVLAVVVVALLVFIYGCWRRTPDKAVLVIGIVVGALVVTSWYITGVLAQDEMNPLKPSAMTLSGPLARFGYLLLTGSTPALSFSVCFVIGTAVMSLLLALISRQFRFTLPRKGMTKWALLGGALMGFGAILAYGCNIGQGMSGLSTLSVESLLAVIGMVSGITLTTRWLENRD